MIIIKFGKNKEVCFTTFNGATYVHLTDAKHCFVEGKFDFSKMKSILFNVREVDELRALLSHIERYD